jgi:hypothetical protein
MPVQLLRIRHSQLDVTAIAANVCLEIAVQSVLEDHGGRIARDNHEQLSSRILTLVTNRDAEHHLG